MVASARYPGGEPAAGVVVRMRRSDYVTQPPFLAKSAIYGADALTDEQGRFTIGGIDPGAYRIEVNDGNLAVLLACTLGTGDTVDLGEATLRSCAAITGSIDSPAGRGHVQIYGLERIAQVDSAGRFAVLLLPEGSLDLRISRTDAQGAALEITNVRTSAGETTTITASPLWPFNRRIYLNTSSTGANVAADIAGFPLLVRLDSTNFDFTHARDSGQDVRFVTNANAVLPFEIAQWDPAIKHAVIWVRTDTIFGNNDRQFITMQWGNPSALSGSNPAAVFDSAGGFAGVWHLDSLDDATGNGNAAVNVNAQSTAGITGGAYSFNGLNSYLQIPACGSLDRGGGDLTIMLWQKTSAHFDGERIYFEHDVWPAVGEYSFSVYDDSVLSFDFPSANAQVRGKGGNNCSGQWTQLAMTFNDQADTGRIYRNGVEVKADTVRGSIGSSTAASYVGCRGGVERFFQGDIDEVWVLSRAMPASWVRLIYESQRVDQAMVRF